MDAETQERNAVLGGHSEAQPVLIVQPEAINNGPANNWNTGIIGLKNLFTYTYFNFLILL